MMLVKLISGDTERVYPGITHYEVTHIKESSLVVESGQDTPGIRLNLVDSKQSHVIKLPEDGEVVYIMDQSTGRTCQSYRANRYADGVGAPVTPTFRTGTSQGEGS